MVVKMLFFKITVFAFLIAIMCSCGGVVGNIEQYPLPGRTAEDLATALNRVYVKHPQLIKNSSMYGQNNARTFYFLINDGREKIVFKCDIVSFGLYDMTLSLASATVWGEIMRLAPNIDFFAKRRYRRLFEREVLPKIMDEIPNP